MKIELKQIPIKDIINSYIDNSEEGVKGYYGKLDIRPAFQREFVYDEKKRNAVIETIRKGFPLNVMYWCKNDDGTFELLDGQQRTISFCQFCANEYTMDFDGVLKNFYSLTQQEKDQILNYECMIYFCEGTDKEKLDWFKVINIAGEKLTDQELRNAVYTGPWLSDAKQKFSKTSCAAYNLGKNYLTGSPIRQDYLQTALKWISNGNIEKYMLDHQQEPNANELWLYFMNVIEWVKAVFGESNYRSQMKCVPWGNLYNKFHTNTYDTAKVESDVKKLMMDDEVSDKKGIYEYIFDKDESHLNLRTFSEAQKTAAYERQGGICPMCKAEGNPHSHYEYNEMEGDHIIPWKDGGVTSDDNLQMLCKHHNRTKSGV